MWKIYVLITLITVVFIIDANDVFVVFLFNTSNLRRSQAPVQWVNWKSCGRNRSHYNFK